MRGGRVRGRGRGAAHAAVPEPEAAAAVLSASQRNEAAGNAMNNIIYLVGLVVVVLAVLAFFGLR